MSKRQTQKILCYGRTALLHINEPITYEKWRKSYVFAVAALTRLRRGGWQMYFVHDCQNRMAPFFVRPQIQGIQHNQ